VCDGERGDDHDERAQPSERNDQREEEEQVVDAVEDVEEAVPHEAVGGLVPPRIELDDAGVAVDVERPLGVAWLLETEHDVHAKPEPGQSGTDGKPRLIG
jgi:hypothetical protein